MNLAATEMSDSTFLLLTAGYAVSGVICVVLAALGVGMKKMWERVFIGLIGAAFVGYAIYLFFVFDGGTVLISYWPLIVPVLLIFNAIRNARRAKAGA